MSYAILKLLLNVINLYLFVILIWIVLGWLLSFGVINPRNPMANQIYHGLGRVIEPVIAPIRKILPPMGGLDLSPIVLIFGLYFLQDLIGSIAVGRFGSIV